MHILLVHGTTPIVNTLSGPVRVRSFTFQQDLSTPNDNAFHISKVPLYVYIMFYIDGGRSNTTQQDKYLPASLKGFFGLIEE